MKPAPIEIYRLKCGNCEFSVMAYGQERTKAYLLDHLVHAHSGEDA
jgi:hypothetical protein